MRRLVTVAAITLLHAGAAAAQQPAPDGSSACNVQIEASPGNAWLISGHDPFGRTAAQGTYSLTFRNSGTGTCRFTPVFRLESGEPFGLSSGTGERLRYLLRDITRSLNATPYSGSSRRVAQDGQLELAPGAQMSLNYEFLVQADGLRNDGEFSQTVRVQAEQADLDVVGGSMLRLGIQVLPSARIGLAGAYALASTGYAVVDLGELSEGIAQLPLQLHVESTRNFHLTLESQNRGRLGLAGTDWRIPYQLSLGGQRVDLANGRGEFSGAVGTGPSRATLPILFHIGDVSSRRAGVYTDVISVAVAAN